MLKTKEQYMKLTAESTVINDAKLEADISEAKGIASNTAQYFWTTQTGTDTGAHITEIPQDQWDDPSSPYYHAGGNLLARSNGVAVRNGLDELAVFSADGLVVNRNGAQVAEFGQDIELTDGTRTVYEVKSTSGVVSVSRLYNVSIGDSVDEGVDEVIQLGRTINTLTSIVVTYSSGSTDYTQTFTSLPVAYGDSYIDIEIGQETTSSLLINVYGGGNTTMLKSIEINFSTLQQTIESTIGAYADKTASGSFRVGNGTATDTLSNAMLVDWAGNAYLNGGLNVNCNADSSGGVSLTSPIKKYSVYSYDGSNYNLNINLFQIGYVVMLAIDFDKSTSTSAGALIFNRSLTGAHIPVPITGCVTGYAPWSTSPIGVTLNDFGEGYAIRIRNCGTSAVTISSNAHATLIYLTDGKWFTDDTV